MIDYLLTKYRTIDITKSYNQLCNRHRNPYVNYNYDGFIDLYEVVFY